MMSSSKLVIGYWHIRGLAAPLRMVCEYAGVDYEDRTFEIQGTPGNWDASPWFGVKPEYQLKNPLINLPFIVDGETVVTQSNACLLYLGRKFKLNGKNDGELSKVEQILSEVMDLRNSVNDIFYGRNTKIEEHWSTTAPKHYIKFDNWLALFKTNFIASDEPTIADFQLWEMLDQHEMWAISQGKSGLLHKFPHLAEWNKRIKALPAIEKYLHKPAYSYPVNNKMAIWK